MEKIQFYHIMPNGDFFYFDYINAWASIRSIAEENKVPCIDGITWIYNNEQYRLNIIKKEVAYIYIAKNKIFIQYNTVEAAKYPAPDNVVVYTPTGEVERILTTPILPTGEKGAGFYQIGAVPNCNNVHSKEYVETYMEVSIWDHDNRPWIWIYVYLVKIETYEFIFKYKHRI